MTTPTRRISFYLKPVAVNSEREACNYLDSLPASERSRAQRAAFLAGLALIKRDPAFAYCWPNGRKKRAAPAKNNIQSKYASAPATGSNHSTSEIRKNIQSFFPE